jgi:hypothetical protein
MSESHELPDTAMATGNDEGEPGRPDTRPLAKDERKLLKELTRSTGGSGEPAVEDGPEMAAAAGDDAPLPAATGGDGRAGDGLDPEFTDR